MGLFTRKKKEPLFIKAQDLASIIKSDYGEGYAFLLLRLGLMARLMFLGLMFCQIARNAGEYSFCIRWRNIRHV